MSSLTDARARSGPGGDQGPRRAANHPACAGEISTATLLTHRAWGVWVADLRPDQVGPSVRDDKELDFEGCKSGPRSAIPALHSESPRHNNPFPHHLRQIPTPPPSEPIIPPRSAPDGAQEEADGWRRVGLDQTALNWLEGAGLHRVVDGPEGRIHLHINADFPMDRPQCPKVPMPLGNGVLAYEKPHPCHPGRMPGLVPGVAPGPAPE